MVVEDDIVKTSDDTKIIGSSSDLSLSFDDSLYLHPNDTGGSPIVSIKLTGTKNYKMWSIDMKFALRNHNKLGFIDGTCKRDDKNLFAGAIYAKTAYEMWNDLTDTYDKVDGYAFLMGLDDSYFAIRSNIFTREPLPSVKATFAIVSGEESHRNVTSLGTTKPTTTAFTAKTFDFK
ncbi:ribonuclease H-like domain-containing protein [Tanacetum coccineum]